MKRYHLKWVLLCLCFATTCAQTQEVDSKKTSKTPSNSVEIFPADTYLEFQDGPRLDSLSSVQSWTNSALATQFGLGQDESLIVDDSVNNIGEHLVYRVQQSYKDIPVLYHESRLIIADEKPNALIAQHRSYQSANTNVPTKNEREALEAANHVAATPVDSRLVFWPVSETKLRLSYQLTSEYLINGIQVPQVVIVDAVDLSVYQRVDQIHSALSRSVHDHSIICQQAGVNGLLRQADAVLVYAAAVERPIRSEGQGPTNNSSVDNTYDALGEYYTFLNDVIGIDSLDNRGAKLKALINFKTTSRQQDYTLQCVGDGFNAFWRDDLRIAHVTKNAMPYIEVIAHEFGHGIISYGSGLIYLYQPGALNESIADAIGITFNAWRTAGGANHTGPIPTDDRTWELHSPIGVIRNVKRPTVLINGLTGRPYPDHMDLFEHLPRSQDHGGVHINSSIMNQAFYLIANGGQHPRLQTGPNINGIGLKKAVKIYAVAGAKNLTPNASFSSAASAFAQVAEDFYGRNSPEWIAVNQAMQAVGISVPAPPPVPQPNPQPQPQPNPQPTPEPQPQPQQDPVPSPQTPEPLPETPPEPIVENNSPPITILLLLAAALLLGVVVILRSRPRPQEVEQPNYLNKSDEDTLDPSFPHQRPSSSSSGVSIATLSALDGSGDIPLHRKFLESPEGLVIGRAPELCHIVMEDSKVSRRHLRLRLNQEQIAVEDMNSSQGTQIDGRIINPFQPTKLMEGQLLRIAGFSYLLK